MSVIYTDTPHFYMSVRQFSKYYAIDPDKWELCRDHVVYNHKYFIGFPIIDRIWYTASRHRLESERHKYVFLQDIHNDLAEHVDNVRKQTEKEIQKIRAQVYSADSYSTINGFVQEVQKLNVSKEDSSE